MKCIVSLDVLETQETIYPSVLIREIEHETWSEIGRDLEQNIDLDINTAKTHARQQGRKGRSWLTFNVERESHPGIDDGKLPIWT